MQLAHLFPKRKEALDVRKNVQYNHHSELITSCICVCVCVCLGCRHTSRFLVIWLAFLPFTLWRACHWVMVPAAVLIAFLLLGVEEIGVQIEEPFGILPLGTTSLAFLDTPLWDINAWFDQNALSIFCPACNAKPCA